MNNRYVVIYLDELTPDREQGWYIADTTTGEIAAGFWYTEEKALIVAQTMNESEE